MKKTLDIFQTALVCVLLVSMTCLSIIYMMSYRSEENAEFTPQMDLAVRETLYKAEYVGLLDKPLVSPYFIGFSFNGERRGFIGGEAAAAYDDINELLSLFMSPRSSAKRISNDDFVSCIGADFAYVKFHTELQRSVIYSIENPDKLLESTGDEYIFEVFIIFGSSETYALARNMRGDCFEYTCSDLDDINKNIYFSYNDLEGGCGFVFGCEYNADDVMVKNGFYEKVCDTSVLLTEDIALDSAVIESGRYISSQMAQEMLLLLGMNPEKVTYHENDDGITYFGEGQNLTISRDGALDLSVSSPRYGIGLSSLIGYNVSQSDYSVLDGIGAALVLAESLGISQNGDLTLAVTCANSYGNEITIGLSYAYNGVIACDDEYALKIVIDNGYIVSVSGYFATARAYDGKTSVDDMTWQLRSYVASSNKTSDIRYIYKMENSRLRLALASCFSVGGEEQ